MRSICTCKFRESWVKVGGRYVMPCKVTFNCVILRFVAVSFEIFLVGMLMICFLCVSGFKVTVQTEKRGGGGDQNGDK